MPILFHGEGADRIDSSIFQQLEKDSDRAIGIVGGAIVEQRLTEALKASFADAKKLQTTIFDHYGALGSFATKIDIAYLTRLVTKEGYDNLRHILKIRNYFAHTLEIDSFNTQCVRDRCLKLTLLEAMIGDISAEDNEKMKRGEFDSLTHGQSGRPPIRFSGAGEKLKDVKTRYIYAAQLFSFRLGHAALNARAGKPIWPAF